MFTLTVVIFALSFMLNLVWENAHMPLYTGYAGEQSASRRFVRSLTDSVGDALVILTLYFLGALVCWNAHWISHMTLFEHAVVFGLGATWATVVEKVALRQGRWQYQKSMPIVPVLNVGLSPFLQLAVLPGVVFVVVSSWLA